MHHYIKNIHKLSKERLCEMKLWNLQNAVTMGKH
jgi:hypothetical protein